MGTLFVVATPIGNLKDISERGRETLAAADCIFAEDTRVARKLLHALEIIGKRIERLDEHTEARRIPLVKELLQEGKQCVLISDAGTPGIADAGSRLVAALRKEQTGIAIVSVPGPSALTAALSVSGVGADRFTFLGYPPQKKGRKAFFRNLAAEETWPVVLFESPHRISRTLADLEAAVGGKCLCVLARELTKVHEEVVVGSVAELQERIRQGRGEFVVIIPDPKRQAHE